MICVKATHVRDRFAASKLTAWRQPRRSIDTRTSIVASVRSKLRRERGKDSATDLSRGALT